MVTGPNRGESETNFAYTDNFSDPKTPFWCKNQGHISRTSRVLPNFLLKFSNFHYHGNRGRAEVNFAYIHKFPDPVNPLLGARIGNIPPGQAEFYLIFC